MKRTYYAATALLPLALLVPVFCWMGLYPFGENTLVWCDMRQQVMPLLMQLKDMLNGATSPFYSLCAAGGMNLWGVWFFFVSSPLSLLVLLWEKADFFLLANLMTLLKISLCALGCAYFLRHRHPTLSPGWGVLLSAGYALSGYVMLFYQNSIWLDAMAIMPLLYCSALRLTKQGGGWGYLFWLTALLMTQYYLGYAVLLFLLLWAALACLFEVRAGERGRFALRVGGFTALALALSSPIWLPSLLQVMGSARTVNVVDSIAKGRWFTHLYTTISFVLCSAALLPLALVSLRRRCIVRPWARVEWLLFVWMLLPLVFDPINKIWHTGSYQAFPVRYGFLNVLLLVSLASAGLTAIRNRTGTKGGLLAMGAVLLTATFLVALVLQGHFIELYSYVKSLWVNYAQFFWMAMVAIGLIVAATLLLLLCNMKILSSRGLFFGFFGLVLLQSLFFSAAFIGTAARDEAYLHPIMALEDRIDDPSFYRVKTERKLFDVNLIGGMGYNTFGHYTSLTREDTLYSLKRLGYSAYWMEAGSHGGTMITDALLQNRYVIKNRPDSSLTTRQVYTNGSYWLYQQTHTMPFGIVSKADPAAIAELPDLPRAMLGARAVEMLLGLPETAKIERFAPDVTENLFWAKGVDGRETYAPTERERNALMVYHLSFSDSTALYFDCFDQTTTALSEPVNGSFSIWVNGVQHSSAYPSQRENGLLYLGTFEEEDVRITVRVNRTVTARSMGLFGVSLASVEALLGADAGQSSVVAEKNLITATATAEGEGNILFLPIPYAEGWNVEVNGSAVEPQQVLGGFIALALEAGENQIAMRFVPLGMSQSLVVALLALVLIALLLLLRRKNTLPSRALGQFALVLLCLAAFSVALLTSVFPMLLHWLW